MEGNGDGSFERGADGKVLHKIDKDHFFEELARAMDNVFGQQYQQPASTSKVEMLDVEKEFEKWVSMSSARGDFDSYNRLKLEPLGKPSTVSEESERAKSGNIEKAVAADAATGEPGPSCCPKNIRQYPEAVRGPKLTSSHGDGSLSKIMKDSIMKGQQARMNDPMNGMNYFELSYKLGQIASDRTKDKTRSVASLMKDGSHFEQVDLNDDGDGDAGYKKDKTSELKPPALVATMNQVEGGGIIKISPVPPVKVKEEPKMDKPVEEPEEQQQQKSENSKSGRGRLNLGRFGVNGGLGIGVLCGRVSNFFRTTLRRTNNNNNNNQSE